MEMIRVTLGPFARSGVETYFGADVPAGVRSAIRHYARRLTTERMPPAPPPRRRREACAGRDDVAVEVAIDAVDEATVAGQALRRGVGTCELIVHAVLVYLAELELLGVPPRDGWQQRSH